MGAVIHAPDRGKKIVLILLLLLLENLYNWMYFRDM